MPSLQRCKLFSITFTILALLGGCVVAQSLHTAGGIVPEASLHGIEGESDVRFEFTLPPINGLPAKSLVPFSELVRWGSWPGTVNHQAVWLQDESWLCGDLQWDSQRLQVGSSLLKLPPIPLHSVRGIVLIPPASSREFIALRSEMRATSGDRDAVWLVGGRKLTGIVRLAANPLSASQQQTLTFEHAGRTADLETDSVRAIVFSPALFSPLETALTEPVVGGTEVPNVALTANRCIALHDGSFLNINSMRSTPGQIALELVAGIQATTLDAPPVFAKEIAYLSGEPAGVEFLADRPPVSFRSLNDSLLDWALGRNQDLWQRPLIVEGGLVARGLAMHATSQAAYRWDGRPARLLAEIVPATPVAAGRSHQGNIGCKVLLARNGKLDTVAEYELSRTADGGEAEHRVFVDVDLSEAQLIALVTQSATLGPYGDHLLWLDVRIAIQAAR